MGWSIDTELLMVFHPKPSEKKQYLNGQFYHTGKGVPQEHMYGFAALPSMRRSMEKG